MFIGTEARPRLPQYQKSRGGDSCRDIIKITKVQGFIGEVVAELKKVSWSTRRELADSTLIVIFSALILGLFVGVIDIVLSKGISLIVR